MPEDVITFKSRANLLVSKSLVLISLGLVCAIFLSENSLSLERPWLLVAISVLLWPKLIHPTLATLQIIIGLALCSVTIAQAFQGRFVLNTFGYNMGIPAGVLALAPLLGAYIARGRSQGDRIPKGLLIACGVCYVILNLHVFFVGGLLHKTYGYGYEHSLAVLGISGLLVLVCFSLYEALANVCTRRIINCMLFITFLLAALIK